MILAYASYFCSYLLNNFKDSEIIKRILLFGSVAKGEATKNSDVDIFIDVESNKFEKHIKKILLDFYQSREALIFKAQGIDNKINLIIGKLEEWKELKESIENTAIVLYGRYAPSDRSGKKYSVIFWDKIEKNRGAFLNKLYGFSSGEKKYKGLVDFLGGRKFAKSSVMIPVENREKILKLVKEYGVNAKIMEVWA